MLAKSGEEMRADIDALKRNTASITEMSLTEAPVYIMIQGNMRADRPVKYPDLGGTYASCF